MSDNNITCPYCGSDMVFKVSSREDRFMEVEFRVLFKCPTCGSASPVIRHLFSPRTLEKDREFSEYEMKMRATEIIRDALNKRLETVP